MNMKSFRYQRPSASLATRQHPRRSYSVTGSRTGDTPRDSLWRGRGANSLWRPRVITADLDRWHRRRPSVEESRPRFVRHTEDSSGACLEVATVQQLDDLGRRL